MAQARIMYIESKAEGHGGRARIGRVTFSKSGRTLRYREREFLSIGGRGIQGNFLDIEEGVEYWISGCRKDGADSLFGGLVDVDEDVREEYWSSIRGAPHRSNVKQFRSPGKR